MRLRHDLDRNQNLRLDDHQSVNVHDGGSCLREIEICFEGSRSDGGDQGCENVFEESEISRAIVQIVVSYFGKDRDLDSLWFAAAGNS